MRKKLSWAAVAGVALALLLLCTPAAAESFGAWQKIFIVDFIFDDHGVTEESSGIWYGTAPDPGIQAGPIEGTLADSGNRALTKFYLRDPRYQVGDALIEHDDGTVSVAEYTQYTPAVEIRVVLPYSPDARTLTLVDTGTGTTLATVDMVQAGSRLAETAPEELEFYEHATFVHRPGSGTSGSIIPPWLFLGAGLVLIAGAVLFTLRSARRPDPAGRAALWSRAGAVTRLAGSAVRARAAGFAGFCKRAVDALYHTSVLINFALIFAMIFVMLQGSFVIAGHNGEEILLVVLVCLEIPALLLLDVSLITTYRSLVNNA
ncbi:hypothetical protein [Methanoregula sp. UBA64]|jgi:hypothetical protein|uniref:hypothetical protein n=1 Tax=Methanoregula sp. UBA64 TaxID=1915554 RepID=UPI0025CDFBB1|nr:hypothetical protein [Methanoregula sp. UBA64]